MSGTKILRQLPSPPPQLTRTAITPVKTSLILSSSPLILHEKNLQLKELVANASLDPPYEIPFIELLASPNDSKLPIPFLNVRIES